MDCSAQLLRAIPSKFQRNGYPGKGMKRKNPRQQFQLGFEKLQSLVYLFCLPSIIPTFSCMVK